MKQSTCRLRFSRALRFWRGCGQRFFAQPGKRCRDGTFFWRAADDFLAGGRSHFQNLKKETPMTILDVTYAATSHASTSTPALPRPGRSRSAVWTGRVLSGLALAFLVWDTLMKLIQHPMALEGSAALGFAPHTVLVVGVIEAL